ncbi:glycosyl hydrolase [Kockiozyma suomiensis]|uniref:glycosyl hydrolase n=1 Tax=Kockiozyma suomiensis TaxID=1337062 RepID=UPI003342FC14
MKILALLIFAVSVLAADSLVVLTRSFALAGSHSANNIKLIFTSPADIYRVSRLEGKTFKFLANTTSYTYDDYDLDCNKKYSYRVTGINGTTTVLDSGVVSKSTYTPASNLQVYDNTFLYSSFNTSSGILVDGVYYRYVYESDSDGFVRYYQQTSTDGFVFTGNKTVMSRDEVCASVTTVTPGLCKIERQSFKLNPTTGKIVFWGHFENRADYTLGELCVAEAEAGEEFDFLGAFRPLGYDSRDYTLYGDADTGEGYIISATGTNTNMNIYSLTSNWTAIDSLLTTVLVKQYREAPDLEKVDGYYYLFTSNSAGWFPSAADYISATNMSGPWSEPRAIADLFTFGTQSGGVDKVGDEYIMLGDRWGANFASEAVHSVRAAPITLKDGFASYEFYQAIEYNPTAQEKGVVAVQSGKVLSVGKTVNATSASDTNHSAELAVDGIKTVYTNYYIPSAVPFYYTIDLEDYAIVSEIDLLTHIVKGSETYYNYTISASRDGKKFVLISDNSANKSPGFVVSLVSDLTAYRYVRIDVSDIINANNGNSATWAAGINEVTVYGTPSSVNSVAKTEYTVSASVANGQYTSDFKVELSTNSSGATIYYTTDLSTPTVKSNKYKLPIEVKQSTDLKAVAIKNQKIVSQLLIAQYVIVSDD